MNHCRIGREKRTIAKIVEAAHLVARSRPNLVSNLFTGAKHAEGGLLQFRVGNVEPLLDRRHGGQHKVGLHLQAPTPGAMLQLAACRSRHAIPSDRAKGSHSPH